MKTLIDRANLLAAATEELHLAATAWSALSPGVGSNWDRVTRAKMLAEKAIRYTQALQSVSRASK